MNKRIVLAMTLATGLNSFASEGIDLEALNLQKIEIQKLKGAMDNLKGLRMGDIEGNGGDVLVCGKGKDQSVEFLDLFEAEYELSDYATPGSTKWELDLGPDTLSVEEKVLYALNKIKNIDKKRFQLYSTWAESFIRDIVEINKENSPRVFVLPDVPDAGNVIMPEGCRLEQLIIQKMHRITKKFYYQLNMKYWNKLNKDHKASVILHEVIYRDFFSQMKNPKKTSVEVRFFNSLLVSNQIYNYTKNYEDYNDLLTGISAHQKVMDNGLPYVRTEENINICTNDRSYIYRNLKKRFDCTDESGRVWEAEESGKPLSLDPHGILKANKRLKGYRVYDHGEWASIQALNTKDKVALYGTTIAALNWISVGYAEDDYHLIYKKEGDIITYRAAYITTNIFRFTDYFKIKVGKSAQTSDIYSIKEIKVDTKNKELTFETVPGVNSSFERKYTYTFSFSGELLRKRAY